MEKTVGNEIQTRIYFVLSEEGLPSNPFKRTQSVSLFQILASIGEMSHVLWIPSESDVEDICRISPFLSNAVVVLPATSEEVYPPWFVSLKMNFKTILQGEFEKEVADYLLKEKTVASEASAKSTSDTHQPARTNMLMDSQPKSTVTPIITVKTPKELLPPDISSFD